MSLLSEAMENCTMIDRLTVADGYGGSTYKWQDGAPFKAAVVFNSSLQAQTGGVADITSFYTVTTEKNVTLGFHDVFRRESDGKVFRVTSDGADKKTPNSATLNMRQVNAEEYTLNG